MPNGSSSAYYNSVLQHSVQQPHQSSQNYFGHVANRNNASGHRYNKAHHQQQQHDVSHSNLKILLEKFNEIMVDSNSWWVAISWKSVALLLDHGEPEACQIAIMAMAFMHASIAPRLRPHRMVQSHRSLCVIRSINAVEFRLIHDCSAA